MLSFMAPGSANLTGKYNTGKTDGDDTGDGAAAWNDLKERFTGDNREAGWATRVKLHFTVKTEDNPSGTPDIFVVSVEPFP